MTTNSLHGYQRLLAVFGGAVLISASQMAFSADHQVIVDLFTEPQVAADVVDGGDGESTSTATGIATILGGSRDVNANALTGSTDVDGDNVCDPIDDCSVISIGGGSLTFNNDTGLTGTAIIQWDGPDQDIALDPDGLGGVDITYGGLADSVEFTIVESDQSFIFSIGAYTDADHFMVYEIQSTIVIAGSPIVRDIPFAVFENPAFCGRPDLTGDPSILSVTCGGGSGDQVADMSNLGALEVRLNLPDESGQRTIALDMEILEIVGEKDAPLGCRLTGGGVTWDDTYEAMVWDGSLAEAEDARLEGTNRYTFGGQAGANTALPPQPKGEWTHHQQSGPAGSFVFRAGTASAPAGTEVIEIRCTDPGGCAPSGNPPSPQKQLDFDCIGTFKNIGSGRKAPEWLFAGANATAEGKGNKDFDGTFHYCEVNVDDNGEGPDSAEGNTAACPEDGFGEKSATELSNCDCPDFYRITIYDGVDAADVEWDEDGNIKLDSLNTTTVIYEVEDYLGRGGNGLQLHNLTGFDRK